MNRQEIVQALKALEEKRRQADLPDLRTLLDKDIPRLKALINRLP